MNTYEAVTNQIIALLEQGQIPWHKPWTGGSSAAISYHTGKPYSLLNQLLLAKPGEYISFLDCKKAGGHVKKGAKAKTVFSGNRGSLKSGMQTARSFWMPKASPS